MLVAVGDAGQARIESARYRLAPAGAAAAVERQYLERAGARHFSAMEAAPAFAHAAAFRNAVARDFAAGAWRALEQLRRALEHGA
jgi:hypothetical protein